MRRLVSTVARAALASAMTLAGLVGVGEGDRAAAASITAPTGLRLNTGTTPVVGSLRMAWSEVPAARAYRVTATPVSGAPVEAVSARTNLTISGLQANTTYQLRAQAWDGAVWSATSQAVRVTTLGSGTTFTFTDVPLGSVFAWETAWLASTGVTTGYDDGTFRPSAPVLREQMAAFLYRSAGRPAFDPPRTSPFRDVPTSSTFYREIMWLASTGVTTGYDDGTFRPSAPVLREQMAAFLYRDRQADTDQKVAEPDPPSGVGPVAGPEAPPAVPCGATRLKADGTPWVCTFSDEFVGTSIDRSKWLPLTTATSGYAINGDCYLDSPDTIAVGDGTVKLTVREIAPMTCESPLGSYTSGHAAASLTTWGLFSQTYGRYEIRARMPGGGAAGSHSAWWLYPQSPGTYGSFPYSGEIDIAEYYSSWPDRVIPMLHYGPSNGGAARTNNYCMIDDPEQFHTYAAEWTASGITILYDGQVCLSHTWEQVAGTPLGAPFDQDFILNLTQGVGAGDNAPGEGSVLPATMEVDYVRVWA